MKLSARNQLKGRVIHITEGSVNNEIVIELAPGVEITSVITKKSSKNLGISIGTEIYTIVKASNVVLGVD